MALKWPWYYFTHLPNLGGGDWWMCYLALPHLSLSTLPLTCSQSELDLICSVAVRLLNRSTIHCTLASSNIGVFQPQCLSQYIINTGQWNIHQKWSFWSSRGCLFCTSNSLLIWSESWFASSRCFSPCARTSCASCFTVLTAVRLLCKRK